MPLDLTEESDGFRRFYAHLLALYQTPPKQTLVFEEPENGIYPGVWNCWQMNSRPPRTPDEGRCC